MLTSAFPYKIAAVLHFCVVFGSKNTLHCCRSDDIVSCALLLYLHVQHYVGSKNSTWRRKPQLGIGMPRCNEHPFGTFLQLVGSVDTQVV